MLSWPWALFELHLDCDHDLDDHDLNNSDLDDDELDLHNDHDLLDDLDPDLYSLGTDSWPDLDGLDHDLVDLDLIALAMALDLLTIASTAMAMARMA